MVDIPKCASVSTLEAGLVSALGGRCFGRCFVCYAGLLLGTSLSVYQGIGSGPAMMASVPVDSHILVWALRTRLGQLSALLHSETPRQPDAGVATGGCQLSAANCFALNCFPCSQGQFPEELKTLVANEPLRTRYGLHLLTHRTQLPPPGAKCNSGSGPWICVTPDKVP